MAENLIVGTEFNSDKHLAGLSDVEAASRIARHGFNELPSSKPRSIFKIAFEVVREPMLLLLVACGSTYLLLGDVQEAIILLIFVVVVITITLYQERKTERALDALRDLSSPRALVVRGGERKRIAGVNRSESASERSIVQLLTAPLVDSGSPKECVLNRRYLPISGAYLPALAPGRRRPAHRPDSATSYSLLPEPIVM
jgi:hypothetical protein